MVRCDSDSTGREMDMDTHTVGLEEHGNNKCRERERERERGGGGGGGVIGYDSDMTRIGSMRNMEMKSSGDMMATRNQARLYRST